MIGVFDEIHHPQNRPFGYAEFGINNRKAHHLGLDGDSSTNDAKIRTHESRTIVVEEAGDFRRKKTHRPEGDAKQLEERYCPVSQRMLVGQDYFLHVGAVIMIDIVARV